MHKVGENYKGEFGMICKRPDRYFYAIECPNCGNEIWLGDDERDVINHLKSEREKYEAIRKYDAIHDVDYD